MTIQPPRHIVWSTDRINLNDPFQKRWLLRQTLMYGKAEDIRALKLADIRQELDQLGLPSSLSERKPSRKQVVNFRHDEKIQNSRL
jgi:hypothetical protein